MASATVLLLSHEVASGFEFASDSLPTIFSQDPEFRVCVAGFPLNDASESAPQCADGYLPAGRFDGEPSGYGSAVQIQHWVLKQGFWYGPPFGRVTYL
ncbi:hypothetical protein MAFF211520_16700 [Ralstonia pseudosolanacearum]|nr:hypothetical protein MAFF211520_16700 [Ralstonia pseudosolanacearum]BEU56618.1 hypothetical protein MAFF211521_16710 [Ralstonia pseudosolanacearum]BEU62695.1 hypothetical protein MAFF301524_24950 [Ralstonia pseudosolanacearum]